MLEEKATATPEYTIQTVRLSHYWPPDLGPNCSTALNGICVSPVAGCQSHNLGWVGRDKLCAGGGVDWWNLEGKVAACPYSWDFGTVFILPGGERFVCVDRLAAQFGSGWIDLLVQEPPVGYGAYIDVQVLLSPSSD